MADGRLSPADGLVYAAVADVQMELVAVTELHPAASECLASVQSSNIEHQKKPCDDAATLVVTEVARQPLSQPEAG